LTNCKRVQDLAWRVVRKERRGEEREDFEEVYKPTLS